VCHKTGIDKDRGVRLVKRIVTLFSFFSFFAFGGTNKK
jgi:hypothetical protein